jgi:hypothetical protein
VQDASERAFTYVDLAPNAEPHTPIPPYLPGVTGTFLGPLEDTFVVLESNKIGADNLAIYAASPEFSEDSLLGYTYIELATGDSIIALWPGPPATQLLVDPEYDAEGNILEDPEAEVGAGLVLASTRQGLLMTALVPRVDEDADPDAELDSCQVQYELQLLEDERILQVCSLFLCFDVWNCIVCAGKDAVGAASDISCHQPCQQ